MSDWKFEASDFEQHEHDGDLIFERMADTANAKLAEWLERSPVVMAHRGPSNPEGVWIAKPWQDADSTHTARLVQIEPIVRDTAESLLREFLDCDPESTNWFDVMNRARKLLQKP